jgi:hypothetical protein
MPDALTATGGWVLGWGRGSLNAAPALSWRRGMGMSTGLDWKTPEDASCPGDSALRFVRYETLGSAGVARLEASKVFDMRLASH